MRILVIGFGSIGRRHYEVLSALGHEISVLTKQSLEGIKTFRDFSEIDLDEFDYFVISNPTNEHFETLNFLNQNVKKKIIFCEKPLFDVWHDKISANNEIFVGFVLRYHPLLQKLKSELSKEKIILAQAKCAQYLPTWRPNTDYRKCYSSDKSRGGGVLLDLSHEIDYLLWLCGDFELSFGKECRISDLEITSDDYCEFLADAKNGAKISLSLDYISKITQRWLLIESLEKTFLLDFIAGILKIADKNGRILEFQAKNLERNFMFRAMHEDILGKRKFACEYEFGLKTMKIIKDLREQK